MMSTDEPTTMEMSTEADTTVMETTMPASTADVTTDAPTTAEATTQAEPVKFTPLFLSIIFPNVHTRLSSLIFLSSGV